MWTPQRYTDRQFQSTLPVGGATTIHQHRHRSRKFQSTLPVGGATICLWDRSKTERISIHAPRGGSDRATSRTTGGRRDFNPRSPWGERPQQRPISIPGSVFQSTLPVGGATQSFFLNDIVSRISIHAPRGGSDAAQCRKQSRRVISIHAPRGGSDGVTLPGTRNSIDFNPRSPWGERPEPRQEQHKDCEFQSTLPVGGATGCSGGRKHSRPYFNPRSPWGERPGSHSATGGEDNFNPRSPWGERRHTRAAKVFGPLFQSTLPVGGATSTPALMRSFRSISIHAPRGGSDRLFTDIRKHGFVFQSTLPVGGATSDVRCFLRIYRISIHAPRGGSDRAVKIGIACSWAFQSTLPVGGATKIACTAGRGRTNFNPRSPWGERQL